MARWNIIPNPTDAAKAGWNAYKDGRLHATEPTKTEARTYVRDNADPTDVIVVHGEGGEIESQMKANDDPVTVATVAKNNGRWRVFIGGDVESKHNEKDNAISAARDELGSGDMIAVQDNNGRFGRNIEL